MSLAESLAILLRAGLITADIVRAIHISKFNDDEMAEVMAETMRGYERVDKGCLFPDSAIAQRAKIGQSSKLKKASIHRPFRRYDPSKSPTRFPEDPFFLLYSCTTPKDRYRLVPNKLTIP